MRITRNPVIDKWEMAESDERSRPTQSGQLIPCTPNRILITDDEPSVRTAIHHVLRASLPPTIAYDLAANGREALDAFGVSHHKVVLMDLSMPVMDGEEAAHAILDMCDERQWVCPSVIFLTGYSPGVAVRNLVASDPAHCLLQKPARNQILLQAVTKRL